MSNGYDHDYKRFRVKRSDGGSTTVSIDPALVIRACRALGSFTTVSRVIREAASRYDKAESSAKNRSEHATRTLEALLEDKRAAKTGISEGMTASA